VRIQQPSTRRVSVRGRLTGPSPTKSTVTVTPKAADGKAITIEGSGVSKAVSFTLSDLKSFKEGYIEDDYYSLNNYGTKKYFHFKGISVWYLLSKKAGIKSGASKVIFTAEDGYSVEYSIADVKRDNYISEENPAKKYKMIIAWEENGKEYDPKAGSPFKLVVGQKEPGDINKPNWIQNLKSIKVQ
jgi:DMSO/TMAO reductase YedYZ molybdopterin-dependent catalytic subunit